MHGLTAKPQPMMYFVHFPFFMPHSFCYPSVRFLLLGLRCGQAAYAMRTADLQIDYRYKNALLINRLENACIDGTEQACRGNIGGSRGLDQVDATLDPVFMVEIDDEFRGLWHVQLLAGRIGKVVRGEH